MLYVTADDLYRILRSADMRQIMRNWIKPTSPESQVFEKDLTNSEHKFQKQKSRVGIF